MLNKEKYEWIESNATDSFLIEKQTKRIVGSVIKTHVWEASVEDGDWKNRYMEFYPAKNGVENQIEVFEKNNNAFWIMLFMLVGFFILINWHPLSLYIINLFKF